MSYRYMRMNVEEVEGLIIDSSVKRMQAIERNLPPKNVDDVIEMLSDQTNDDFRVYQEIGPDDIVKTVATGMDFFCSNTIMLVTFMQT